MSSAFLNSDRLQTQRRHDARGPLRVPAEPNTELSAAAVATAFRDDEAAAAAILAERVQPLVARLVQQLSAWANDGDDLVQDVLVTALQKRKTFDGRSRLETWITCLTINRCRAHARKQWLRRRLFHAWAQRQQPRQQPSVSGAVVAEAFERAEAVRAAVAALPQQAREAIVLCYLEELTVSEAAAALGVRRGTLEVRLTRARNLLRLALGDVIEPAFAKV
jgi:RNA polymerase sigma factor (sigma-70 family)